MITAVAVAGEELDLGEVIAEEITVLHGRAAVDDEPTASSATIRLLLTSMPAWTSGDTLTIATAEGPLFTGVVTDRRISRHVDTKERGRVVVFELIGTGTVATLGYRVVGDEPWPQESETLRADRILALAGAPYAVTEPETNYLVTPRDVDARTALDLLTDLAADTGSAVFDLPDGTVVYQPIRSRSRPQFYFRWMDFDPAFMWSDFDPEFTWADFDIISPASQQPLPLPPSAVGWEPEWVSSAAAIVNSIRVGYGIPAEGSEQDTISLEAQSSIDRIGKRYAYLGSQLATTADASARASHIITTQSEERWQLASVDVYGDALTPAEQSAMLALRCGDWVGITGLPMPAPASDVTAICEGWAFRLWRDDRGDTHVAWTLALSDPLASLAVMTWADFPPDYQWADFPPLLTWDSITDLTSIGA